MKKIKIIALVIALILSGVQFPADVYASQAVSGVAAEAFQNTEKEGEPEITQGIGETVGKIDEKTARHADAETVGGGLSECESAEEDNAYAASGAEEVNEADRADGSEEGDEATEASEPDEASIADDMNMPDKTDDLEDSSIQDDENYANGLQEYGSTYDSETYGTVTDASGIVDEGAYFGEAIETGEEASRNLAPDQNEDPKAVKIQLQGTYYTKSAEAILDQINRIRKEACEEGIISDGRALTMADYVPLKWSNNLEQSVRLRAMESSMTISHANLYGGTVWDYIDQEAFCTYGENLAWNNNHNESGITYGINQFYEEKENWKEKCRTGSTNGQTGHYTNMINPRFTHVGVAACQMPNTRSGWICIAMQLGGVASWYGGSVDETKITQTGAVTNSLKASSDILKSMSIKGEAEIKPDQTTEFQITGKVYNEGFSIPAGTDSNVVWSSSDNGVATVDNGVVKGIKEGTVTIKATVGTVPLSKSLAVYDYGITLPVTELFINRNEAGSGTVVAEARPANSINPRSITWKSSNTNVISIDDNGYYTAKKPGEAVLTVTGRSYNAKLPAVSASCKVTVTAPLTAISFGKNIYTLDYTGSTPPTAQLKVLYTPSDTDSDRTVTWRSKNERVAVVENGKVTAVAGGEAVIEASAGGFTAECTVKVNAPVKSLVLAQNEKYIFLPGGVESLSAQITPIYASEKRLVFTSGDPELIQMSSDGENYYGTVTVEATGGMAWVTIKNMREEQGYVSITVSTLDKKFKKTVEVYVVNPTPEVESVSLSRSVLKLIKGENYQLTAKVLPSGAVGSPSFYSGNYGVASVDASGKVTAVASGETTVTASCNDKTAECLVIVKDSDVEKGDAPYDGDDRYGIWVAKESFRADPVYTGKAVTQPKLRVYYRDTLLKQKTDYTLSYKNNVKATKEGAKDSERPYVKVTLKGQYQGGRTYYYDIKKVSIDLENPLVTEPFVKTAAYNKKTQKLVPELYYNGIKLKNGTDYTCGYPDGEDAYKEPGSYNVELNGKGNFEGNRTVKIVITQKDKNLSAANVTVKPFDENAKKIYYGRGISVTVKCGGNVIPEDYYRVVADTSLVGNGVVSVYATSAGEASGFFGAKKVGIKVYPDRQMSQAEIGGFIDSMMYDAGTVLDKGGMLQGSASLSFGGETLAEGTDYTVKYKNASKAGTATVTYTGKGRYAGSLKKSYKITANDGTDLTLVYKSEVRYTKGGVTPDIKVKDGKGNYLALKKDFTVSVLNKSNKKPGNMVCRIVGKGNYKGYKQDVSIQITSGRLSDAAVTVADKAFSTKRDGWKAKIKLTDTNGKALSAGTDYDKKLVYTYDGITSSEYPDKGTTVYVTAIGRGNYAGSSITGSYRIYERSIGSAVAVVAPQIYTGREVEPGKDDIEVYPTAKDASNKTNKLIYGTDYVIAGYTNSVKSGKGKVILCGIGSFGGTKAVTFKIKKAEY